MVALSDMTRKKKPKKESAGALLLRVTKEMDQPRFVESARKEENANHHVREHSSEKLKP
jgi:hypothetical protein